MADEASGASPAISRSWPSDSAPATALHVHQRDASPLIGVVILNWNGGALTIECAESVLVSDYDRFFVIVVDNGSTDGSEAQLSRWMEARSSPRAERSAAGYVTVAKHADNGGSVALIRLSSNLGYGAGNNVGIAQALRRGADAVWVLNNDTTVDREAMGHLVEVLHHRDRVGLVGSCVLEGGDRAHVQCRGGGIYGRWTSRSHLIAASEEPSIPTGQTELDYVSGASIFLSRRCLEDIGGFEEGYFLYCEEVDLARRAAAAGWAMAVARRAVVWHVGGASSGSHADLQRRSIASFYYGTRSAILLARKFSPLTVPTVVLARLGFAARLALRRHRSAARSVMNGVRSGLRVRDWSRTPRFPRANSS